MLIRLLILFIFTMTSCVNAETCSQYDDLLNDILERKEIKVGWVSAKPFQYRDEYGKLTGAFVNAGNMLAADLLDVKITWIEARWDTFIAGLQSGKFDIVISNVARRPNRATSVWFTKPIAIGSQALLVRKSSGPLQLSDIDTPDNTIVVRMGSAAHITYAENSSNFFKKVAIKPIVPPVSPEQEVASGHAIAMGAPLSELAQIVRANSDWAKILTLPNLPSSGGIGFVVPQCQHNLLHFMNLFVDTLIETSFMLEQVEHFPDLVAEEYVAPTTLIGDLFKRKLK